MKKYVPITEETEMLSLYMDIESLRFEIQFDYEISIPENLKTLNISIPPMIIQPYIENAIWHGISNRKEVKGKIIISFELIDDEQQIGKAWSRLDQANTLIAKVDPSMAIDFDLMSSTQTLGSPRPVLLSRRWASWATSKDLKST